MKNNIYEPRKITKKEKRREKLKTTKREERKKGNFDTLPKT